MIEPQTLTNHEDLDLRLLQSKYATAARNALAILLTHGAASKDFLEAERKRELIRREISSFQQLSGSPAP